MSEQVAVYQPMLPEAIEQALVLGDLSSLTPAQRLLYYHAKCKSLGLNPLTKPFAYLTLNGKLVLYALKDAKEQLRKLHGVSLKILDKRVEGDLYLVTVQGTTRDGRTDEDMGFALIKGQVGDAYGNAILKAITKAKSRVTLSICGLGDLDETEIDSIPNAVVVPEATLAEESPPSPPTLVPAQRATPLKAEPAVQPTLPQRPELLAAILAELKRLSGGSQQDMADYSRQVFGQAVGGWKLIEQLPDGSLRRGLAKLQAMVKDVPPDDVPIFDGPELAQETRSEDESVPEALPQGEVVTTGEPDAEETAAEELPPESPRMVGTVVDPGDVGVLVLWAEMNNQRELLDQLLVGKRIVEGLPVLSENSYKMIWTKVKAAIAVTVPS